MLGTLETVGCIIFRNKMCTRVTIILSEYITSSQLLSHYAQNNLHIRLQGNPQNLCSQLNV